MHVEVYYTTMRGEIRDKSDNDVHLRRMNLTLYFYQSHTCTKIIQEEYF